MHINCHKYKLYNFLLKNFKLDDIEYGYLYPLLEQTEIYGGYSDIIFNTHQLSNQIQNTYLRKKKLKKQSIVFNEYLYLKSLYVNFLENHQNFKKKIISYHFQSKNYQEIILMCLIYILYYKLWKIKHWYPKISKLAFNYQEVNVARYFLQKRKLEFKMITMLII